MKDGRLLSKASGGNGQIRYGADVINRIIEQGKPGGRKKLQDAILKETLVPLLQTLCKDAKLPPARIVRLCVASNTTMNHLFVGVDADPVRMEPYIPAFFHWDGLRVHDLGLPAHPDARHSPCAEHRLLCRRRYHRRYVRQHALGPRRAVPVHRPRHERRDRFRQPRLHGLVRLLGRPGLRGRRHLLRHARNGRRDRVLRHRPRDDGADVRHHRRAGQKPVGLCGSGIIDTIAELFHAGILNSKGIFVREGKRVAHDRHGCGRYILATRRNPPPAARSP